MDTIYALASGQGKAGVAVVRVSGPDAFGAAEHLCGQLPPTRRAGLRRVRDRGGLHLDTALVIAFGARGSFTGEPVVELHLHGSRAVVSAVLRTLCEIDGLRLAEPGEFTRRALENGRMDLAEVEGLADLIDAETEAQRRQAMRVFSGALGALVEVWRSKLLRAIALMEATIDFADEDVPEDVVPEVSILVTSVIEDLRAQVAASHAAERVRDGFEVAILGAPNIGKSTLLNTLAGRDAALTSDIAGTTRDVIEVRMDIAGLPVTLLDTAGLRETEDHVERLGIARAHDRARKADLRVVLTQDGTLPEGLAPTADDIVVLAKADLSGSDGVSGLTGAGVQALLDRIGTVLQDRTPADNVAVKERHRAAMARSVEHLASARHALDHGFGTELVAEDLRQATRALDSLIGRVDVEDVLGEIFTSFCLGK